MKFPDKLISVIITCYNSEKFISYAIDSVLRQTYKNIELIIVNDGSKGDFEKIVNKYKYNENIKFVTLPENRGLFYARLSGFKNSTGEYIGFIDADDSISIDYYRRLIFKAEEEKADIAISDMALKYSEKDIRYLNLDPIFIKEINIKDEEVFDFFMQQHGLCFTYYVIWNKLYKRQLFEECIDELDEFANKAGNITMCEDIAYSNILWMKAKKVVNVHNILYYYSQHESQETQRIFNKHEYILKLIQVEKVFSFFYENLLKYKNKEIYLNYFNEWSALYGRMWYTKAVKLKINENIKTLIEKAFNQTSISQLLPEDSYFGSIQTALGDNFEWLENIKSQICNPDVDYISFDIFDTLLIRPLLKPDDLFSLITQEANKILHPYTYIDFKNIRVESERKCRENMRLNYNMEDITLDEIYEYMGNFYNLPIDKIQLIKQLELDAEANLLFARKLGKDLYNLAAYYGKNIICISDMYLPHNFIVNLLIKNGYDNVKYVFVSSEKRVLKGSGKLYAQVVRELNITEMNKILHIGDNWQSDIVVARSMGMKTGLLPNISERILGNNPGTYSGNVIKNITENAGYLFNTTKGIANYIGIRCMLGLIATKLFDENILSFNKDSDFNANPFMIGYFALGMHLYAVANWVIRQTPPGKTVHFIARDGYLVQKAVEILDDDIQTNYLYFSRKAIVPFLINSAMDIAALTTFIRWQSVSPTTIWNLFNEIVYGNDNQNFIDFCKKIKFHPGNRFLSEAQFIVFMRYFYDEMIDKVKARDLKEKLIKYFGNYIKPGDIFFDLGYSGRNEELFSKLLGMHIHSCYIHTNADTCERRLDLSDSSVSCFYDTDPVMFVLLRESLFSELGPSCITYKNCGNTVTQVFEKYDNKFQIDFYVNEIQRGGLEFVKDFSAIFYKYKRTLFYRQHDASMPYEYFLHFARGIDRSLFRYCIFEDDLYAGERLNTETYWINEQNKYIERMLSRNYGVKDGNNISSLNELLNKSLDELKIYKKKCDILQNELDKRWIIINLLFKNLKNQLNISLEDLESVDIKQILSKTNIQAPPDFDETAYCAMYPDVVRGMQDGLLKSPYYHYILYGYKEGRKRT